MNSFFKKAASHATWSFLLCIDWCEIKNVRPLLLFFAGDNCLLSLLSLSLSLSLSVCLYQTSSSIYLLKPPCLHETNFPYERGHSIAHSTFKTCVQRRKDYLGLFLNTNPSGRSKSAYQIDFSRHLSFYEIQALSAYISTVVLDDNKRHSINEVLEFLFGVGTFTNTSSLFDTQGLQFVTMNKLKKSMPGDL